MAVVSAAALSAKGFRSLSGGRCFPSPHLLNHDLWGEGLSICSFPSFPKDSDAAS